MNNVINKYRNRICQLMDYVGTQNDLSSFTKEFIQIEYLQSSVQDDLDSLISFYHYIDNLDDEYILAGEKYRYLRRDGDKVIFIAGKGSDEEIITVCDVLEPVIYFTFLNLDGTMEEMIPVTRFIQTVNGLLDDIKKYKFIKGVWLQDECRKQCVQHSISSCNEV